MREKRFGKRCLTWVLIMMMTLSLLPVGALAAGGGSNYFYFMSGTDDEAVVVATKVLHENDAAITDFTDVSVPLDMTHGVTGWYTDKALTTPVTTLFMMLPARRLYRCIQRSKRAFG